jgi:hypothetical protein
MSYPPSANYINFAPANNPKGKRTVYPPCLFGAPVRTRNPRRNEVSMRGLQRRVRALRSRAGKKRQEKRKRAKPQSDTDIATWKPRFLYLLDIEAIRRIPESELQNALTHCERISYKEWMAARGKRSRRSKKSDTWYLVLNPPEPFLPVTAERLKRYLRR